MDDRVAAHVGPGLWLSITSREPLRPFDGIELWSIDVEALMLSLVKLAPGAVVPLHHHINVQAGSVVEGKLTFTIGDETREVTTGDGYIIPPDIEHGAVAGPQGSLVVEVFSPPRDAYRMRYETPA